MSDIQTLTPGNDLSYGNLVRVTTFAPPATPSDVELYRGFPIERYVCTGRLGEAECLRCRTHPPCIGGGNIVASDSSGLWLGVHTDVSPSTGFPGSIAVLDDPGDDVPGEPSPLDVAITNVVSGRLDADARSVFHIYRITACLGTPTGSLVGKILVVAVPLDPL